MTGQKHEKKAEKKPKGTKTYEILLPPSGGEEEAPDEKNAGGRPMLFEPTYESAEALAAKIDEYFNSIRTMKPMMQTKYESGEYSAEELKNMPDEEKIKLVPVRDMNGNPLFHVKWVVPPREGDLHRYLGMKSRDTWARYQKMPMFSDTIACAKQFIEDWLKAEAIERNGNTTGVQFILRCCYGYKDVQYSKVETVGRLEDHFD